MTGAGGWLGRALVEHLSGNVLGLTRTDLDCADPKAVEAALAAAHPHTVVHLAGSLSRTSDEAQWRDTFAAGRTVVEAAARLGVPHLVMAGTMDELGNHAGVLTTDLEPRPRTTYGLCKSLVGAVARFETGRNAHLRVDWFRPTTVYGPGQRGPMLVPAACAAARAGEPAPFTSGEQQRDFLYVGDLVRWLGLVVEPSVALAAQRGFHLHHLGTGVGVAVRDVLELIAGQMPRADFRIGALPSREHEPLVQVAPRYTSPDQVLAQWAPEVDWRDGMARTVDWWRAPARPLGSTA